MTTISEYRPGSVAEPTRDRGLYAFLSIAFGVAWGWEAVAYFLLDWPLTNVLVQLPVGFAPAIAAVIVRRWVTREGFADAGSSVRLRTQWRYYLLAWWGPLGVAAAVVGLAVISGHGNPVIGAIAELIPGVPVWAVPLILTAVAAVGAIVFWGEEFGWTGYLLKRVAPGRPRRAALVAGLIAAVWHYPLALLGYVSFDNLVLGLVGWTAWILCQEVVLAWLRDRSGSVWPACLAHAGNNLVLAPLTTAVLAGPGGFGDDTIQFLVVLILVIVAAGPFVRLRRADSADRTHPSGSLESEGGGIRLCARSGS